MTKDAPSQPESVLKSRHKPVGELLQSLGRISQADLAAAMDYKKQRGMKLGQALVELKLVTEKELSEALRRQGKIGCINLTPGLVDHQVAGALGPERSRELNALAINKIAGTITIAMEDPGNVYAVDEIALFLRAPVLAVHAEASAIRTCIDATFAKEEPEVDPRGLESIVSTATGLDVELGNLTPEAGEEQAEVGDIDQPVINLIRSMLEEAYDATASDIHLEPRANAFVIRFRVDGSLYERLSLPRGWARPCVARLKVIADMDIAQRRLPQDGRAQAEIHGRKVDLRIATSPTLAGESAVIRILDGGRELRDIESLDLDPSQLAALVRMMECPDGFVLATGPTGSGKTTTLYAMLKRLNKPDTKIITLEDPVENQLEGVSQISANVKIGLTFAKGLRSILRQDPDIVLVGEIRDEETAEIAVQAALTGHLVLSTLHTVGAAETITRLGDMNVEPYLLADTLRGIVSQRLIRRICAHCRETSPSSAEILERLGLAGNDETLFYVGRGCDACHGTGYKGRLGLYEVMLMTPEMCTLVREGLPTHQLHAAAIKAGLVTLRDDGLRKARTGQTSLSEVLSVTARG